MTLVRQTEAGVDLLEFESRTGVNGMRDWKDRLGIFASAACAVHCAATPILVAVLPTLKLTEWMADPQFHQIFAVVCCGLVALAIAPAVWRFRDFRLLSLASTGLGLILTAAFVLPDACCTTSDSTSHAHVHSHAGHDPDHHHHDEHDGAQESESPTVLMAGLGMAQPWMTPLGGLLLIVAHGLNMRRRGHRCSGSHPHDGCVIKLPEHESSDAATLARAS